MSSTYSSSLRIELIGSGDQAGAWGTTTNGNLEYILDTAIAGYQAVTVTSTNQALTYVNGASSTASLNESIYAMLKFNSAAAASAIYAPPASKQYIIWNNSGYTITIYNSTVIGNTTAAGTGVAITNGNKVTVWSDGTNFYEALPNTLPIANGGTGQTTQQTAINALVGAQTNNRVLRSDGTNSTLSQVALATDVTGTLPVANGGTGVTSAAAITSLVGNLLFPVGSIYTNATNATNPGTLLGFGTWTAFGAGRVAVGFDAGNVLFDTAEETGGSADAIVVSHTHTASVTDPGHNHTYLRPSTALPQSGSSTSCFVPANITDTTSTATTGITVANSTEGSSATNANYQPYITVYMWKRTA